jgi:hypothetical protein
MFECTWEPLANLSCDELLALYSNEHGLTLPVS